MNPDTEQLYEKLVDACRHLVQQHDKGVSHQDNWFWINEVYKRAADFTYAREMEQTEDDEDEE